MTLDGPQEQSPGGRDELLARFNSMISGLDHAEPPPSRRRPRRDQVVTYRIRVDLDGTKPPLWRRLELASDLFLHEVHDILQASFGWTDSHLHRFGSGTEYYGRDTEYYLCPFDVEEGEPGVPEEEVRLDEVLVDAGDTLFYNYDFGDDWQHTVRLEAVLARDSSAQRAVCTAGRRAGPAEDCGGISGYEMIVAATDQAHPEHREAAAAYAQMFGDDLDPAAFAPTPFDLDEINAVLTGSDRGDTTSRLDLATPVQKLIDAVRDRRGGLRLRQLLSDAALDQPVQVDVDTASQMVRPYSWLLDRVGADGIALTGAGYLPPAHVEAAMTELGLAADWIGKGNREVQTLPVLDLRQSAQRAGLVRKHRNRLVLTPNGRAVRTDPVKLWWLLAARTPHQSKEIWQTQAGLIRLAMTAARSTSEPNSIIADLLGAIGWAAGDGAPVSGPMASEAAWDTTATLRRMGALDGRPEQPTPQGVTFARAALTTWT